MFKKISRAFMAGVLATMFAVPSMVSAHAVLSPEEPLLPSVQAPSALGNYIKGSKDATGKFLGLGRGYQVVPLSVAAIGDDTDMNEGMWMESTAYSPYEAGAYTATGDSVRYGIAAVDTNVIPLGTNLYIEGYGHALAADTGGAIRGNRIDLAFDSYQEALNWGRRDVLVKMV